MRNNNLSKGLIFLLAAFLLIGCYKNNSNYYPDDEDEGLAIFSNSGNNVASCFVNGNPWRTIDRKTSGFNSRTSYEIDIYRQEGNAVSDTLIILWSGRLSDEQILSGIISLHLAMPKNFSYNDVSALEGRRLQITPSNGYFTASFAGLNRPTGNGTGNIFFYKSTFDSSAIRNGKGRLSGLFDADFINNKMERGRFDHNITFSQVLF